MRHCKIPQKEIYSNVTCTLTNEKNIKLVNCRVNNSSRLVRYPAGGKNFVPVMQTSNMENNNERDIFQSGTSTKPGNYQQNDMMRSSGDNDEDRIVKDDPTAREATDQAYFDKAGTDNQSTGATKTEQPGHGDRLVPQSESLKNSK